MTGPRHEFRFTVLGRYPARLKGNAPAVTVNVAVGEGGKVVHAGTLTMTEAEWEELATVLQKSLGERVTVEDQTAG